MKKAVIIIGILIAGLQLAAKEKIEIPALKAVELTYPEFAEFNVKLSNKSAKQVEVSVINPATGKQVSGFGLGSLANAELFVAEGNILKLKNNSTKAITVVVSFVERKPDPYYGGDTEMIQFTLHNSSLKSIPLVIPNVMNPNLSPMSNSGVALKVGQKVYLKKGVGKVLLFTVDNGIQAGDKIDVAKLLKDLEEKD